MVLSFEKCVGKDYLVVIFYHVCSEVFFKIRFKPVEDFLGNWQMTPDVIVDVFAFEVFFLRRRKLDSHHGLRR